MKKIKISIFIVLILMFAVSCKKENSTSTQDSINKSNSSSSTETTESSDKEGFKEGNIAPDFEVRLLSGETSKLSDYKGKIVLLNFWATWCGPCQIEMPDFQKLHEEYGENLVILAIDLGEQESEVNEFIEAKGYTFDIGIDEMAEIKYPILAFPTTFLLNKDGRIDYFGEGVPSNDVYSFYKEKIDNLLK